MKSFKKIKAMDYSTPAQQDAADAYIDRFMPTLNRYQDAGILYDQFTKAYDKIRFTDVGYQAIRRYRWRQQEAEDLAAGRII